MLASISTRGPDDVQHIHGNWFSLGVCRLAIVAVGSGQQPVSDPQHGIHLAFNGEIYNYEALRRRLLREDGIMADSEAEVLLHRYIGQGPTFVEELDGDFAIVVLDSRSHTCYLFRDPSGVKPLYYAPLADGQTWAFASHVKPFFRHPQFTTDVDAVALAERRVLHFWSSERTFFDQIRQLPPGHRLQLCVIDQTGRSLGPKIVPFVSSPQALEETEGDPSHGVDGRCSHLLRRAVTKRVKHAEMTPIVLALSGGIDSSLLAAMAARDWGERVVALTLFDDSASSDRHYAACLAREIGMRHALYEVKLEEFLAHYPRMVAEIAGPSQAYTPYFLGRAVRDFYPSAKVLLCGEGADEVFWGYPFFADLGAFIETRLRALDSEPPALIEQSPLLQRAQGWKAGREATAWLGLAGMFQRDQLVSLHLLPFDHGPMAHALECRVPFLDIDLIRYAETIPPDVKVLDRTPKILLRFLLAEALQDRPPLARNLLTRPKAPAYFTTRKCQAWLKRFLTEADRAEQLGRHDLAAYSHDTTDLFWLASTVKVFLELRGEVDGLTFPDLVHGALAAASQGGFPLRKGAGHAS